MTRIDQKMARADRLLREARDLIVAAMDLDLQRPRATQYGGMEMAGAADATRTAQRLLGYAKERNGYGQPRG